MDKIIKVTHTQTHLIKAFTINADINTMLSFASQEDFFFNSVKFYHLLFLYIEKTSTNTVTEVVTIHSLILLLNIYDGLLFL